jgi:hypothetical protein
MVMTWAKQLARRLGDVVANGVARRDVARRMAKQQREHQRKLDREAYEADPPSRRKVFTYGVTMTAITAFLIWAIPQEIRTHDSTVEKAVVLVVIVVCLMFTGFPLFSGFMARTMMAEPWVPLFRFLDAMRVSLAVVAGFSAYVIVKARYSGNVSLDYFRAAGELIALLAITLAVEARLSSASREDPPFRGILVLIAFAGIGFGEFTCLHVIATQNETRTDLAVVSGVLVGMAVSVALLAALGPMPYSRAEGSRPLRPPPPTKPEIATTVDVVDGELLRGPDLDDLPPEPSPEKS